MGDTQPDKQDSPRVARRSAGSHAGQEAAVQSVQRAIWILNCFTRERPAWGVTDLSKQLGLHKSTVSRLLAALRHEGLVTQLPRNGKYRLGSAVVRLAGVALESLKLPEVAEAPMLDLSDETGETVSLIVADGDRCVALRTIPSPQLVCVVKPSSWEMSPAISAAGQILLAHRESGRLYLNSQEAAPGDLILTPGTLPTDVESHAALLAGVRDAGVAIVRGEWIPDLVEVAVPIWDHRTRVVGALEISGPAHRMGDARVDAVLLLLRRAAARIGDDLGYMP